MKNSTNKLIVTIIFLVIVILGLSSYIILEKMSKNISVTMDNNIPKTIHIGTGTNKTDFNIPNGATHYYIEKNTGYFNNYNNDINIAYHYIKNKSANEKYKDIEKKVIESNGLVNNISINLKAKTINGIEAKWDDENYTYYIFYPITDNSCVYIYLAYNYEDKIELNDLKKYLN